MGKFHSAALSKGGQVLFPAMWEQMFWIIFLWILGSKDLSVANKNVFIDCNSINLYGETRKLGRFRNCSWDGQSWVLIPAGRRRSLYSKTWRRALDPTQPPMQLVPGFISWVKAARAWCWTLQFSAEIKIEWSHTSTFPFISSMRG